MKKFVVLSVVVSMLISLLAGCGSNSNDDAEYLEDLKADKFVTLGVYKGIEVTVDEPIVTEADIDDAISSILANYPMLEPYLGPGEAGDEVIIDFIGTIDGVAFENGSAENYPYTLGSYGVIPDLCDGMIGMSIGDVRDIPVVFPETYHQEDLAGVSANFQVTMQSVERPVVILGITDEYVTWFTEGTYTNVSEFREMLNENMLQEVESAYENEVAAQISMAVIANAEFKAMPAAMVNRINEALISSLSYYASMYGLDIDTYMMLAGISGGDIPAETIIADQAEQTAKHYIAYQAIADIEGLNITDDEANAGLAELAASAGVSVEDYSAGMDFASFKEYLLIEKVAEFLAANAVIIH